jgi:hypothetical protein
MVKYYQSHGIEFVFVPLKEKGRARSFKELCPDLDSGKPEDLGAYYKFYKKRQNPSSNIILIGEDYYTYDNDYNIEFQECWRKLTKLGHLGEAINADFE